MRTAFAALLICVLLGAAGPPAHGAERVGDSLALYALQDLTDAEDALERELLALIEARPLEDRFELYRTYGALVGAWTQVELAQTLIEEAVATTAPSEEEAVRTTLRDQAQFALWELDEARLYLERNAPGAESQHARINAAIRSLLADTQPVFTRLRADQ